MYLPSASPDVIGRIRGAISRHALTADVRTIWEIGSRDGLDGLALLGGFPRASVVCFEPNPDTFERVRDAAAQSEKGSMSAHPYALCNKDGSIEFYKIDPIATKTTWQDGNPGASSLYLASGEYPFEDYVQVPVVVPARRAATLIKNGFACPELIWVDVQGAELDVLRGFGEHLRDVQTIYVELSLREMYKGQALAPDAVSYLQSMGLRWHSVVHSGAWQFDALFVRPSRGKWRLWARDRALSMSLSTRPQYGIAQDVRSAVPPIIRKTTRRIRRLVRQPSRTLRPGGVPRH